MPWRIAVQWSPFIRYVSAGLALCVMYSGLATGQNRAYTTTAPEATPLVVVRAFQRVTHLRAYLATGYIVSTYAATGRSSEPRATVRQILVHRNGGWNYYNRIVQASVVTENLQTPTRICEQLSTLSIPFKTWTCNAAPGNHYPNNASSVESERWTRVGMRRVDGQECAYDAGRSRDVAATGGDISACIDESTATVVALDAILVSGTGAARIRRVIDFVISRRDDPTLANALPRVPALGRNRWR